MPGSGQPVGTLLQKAAKLVANGARDPRLTVLQPSVFDLLQKPCMQLSAAASRDMANDKECSQQTTVDTACKNNIKESY